MTAHDPAMGRMAARLSEPVKLPGHSLNGIDTQKLAKRLVVFTPAGREIDALVARARVASASRDRSDPREARGAEHRQHAVPRLATASIRLVTAPWE